MQRRMDLCFILFSVFILTSGEAHALSSMSSPKNNFVNQGIFREEYSLDYLVYQREKGRKSRINHSKNAPDSSVLQKRPEEVFVQMRKKKNADQQH